MHINKLTGLHGDNFAKKAVPAFQTKTCQNGLPCRSTRHPPVSVVSSRLVSGGERDGHQLGLVEILGCLFRKLRVDILKVWRRKFLQNRVLSTVSTTARPNITRL